MHYKINNYTITKLHSKNETSLQVGVNKDQIKTAGIKSRAELPDTAGVGVDDTIG